MDTSAARQQAVLAALDHLTAQGGEVNISTVARAAGVSRQFVYTPDAARGRNAADAVRDAQPRESTRHDVALGLRADRRVLAVKVERHAAIVELKAQIEAHARQRQRWLGSQLNTGVTTSTPKLTPSCGSPTSA